MRIGKVIVLAISGRNNKVHKLHETVNENMFPKGRFDALLSGGYIKLTEEDDTPVKPVDETEVGIAEHQQDEKKAPSENSGDPGDGDPGDGDPGDGDPGDEDEGPEHNDIKDTTRNEIMEALQEMGIAFNKNESKEELYKKFRAGKMK